MVVVACPAKAAKPSVCYLLVIRAFPIDPCGVLAGLPTEHATVTKRNATFTQARLSRAHIFMSLQRDPFVKTSGDRRELNATTPVSVRNVKKMVRRSTFRNRGYAAEPGARKQDIELKRVSQACDNDARVPTRQNAAFEQIKPHLGRVARISGPVIFIPISRSSLIDYFAQCGRVASPGCLRSK
jgi:hypothetical protein